MLIPNSKFGCYLSFAAIVVMLGGVSGCQESAVKRDPLAPPVSKDFIPAGHIQAQQKVEDIIPGSPGIPSVMDATRPKLPDLNAAEQLNLYSVSAVQVPVAELLHQIAKDSGKQIDLYSGIQGRVTINAINQPLEKVLERIADQVGLMYVIDGGTIVIKPDIPEWRNYNVDYVFIDKVTNDTINMKMNVSAGAMGTTGATSTANTGSSTNVTVKSEHKFWERLRSNIEVLAQLDPFETSTADDVIRVTSIDRAVSNKSLKEGDSGSTITASGQNNSQSGTFSKTSKSVNTVINPEAGVISVYTTSKKHKAIKEYIADISVRAQRQVLIEATVVEVVLNDQYQAGIDWTLMGNRAFGADGGLQISSPFSGPTNGFSVATVSPGVASGDWNILSNLALLKQFGDSKVLSSPKIMAINNQTALLKVVENLVYFTVDVTTTAATTTGAAPTSTYETQVNTVPVGFTMSVTPFVSADGDVTLNVRPTISRLISYIADPNPAFNDPTLTAPVQSLIPVIQEKEMSSVLKLRDRQTAIIGGLIEDNNANNRKGLPWLGDVPVLGDLFSRRDDSTSKSELVIFIRPVIVKNPDVDNGDLKPVSQFLKTANN